MATRLDPYATLGIPADATRAEAGRAHRRLAKEFHPDVNPGRDAAVRMRRLNEAWRILSDPVRRARYDSEHRARTAAPSWAGSSGSVYGYGQRTGSATWTAWPDERAATAPRGRRPARAAPVEPGFGDRPYVLLVVWVLLGLLYFIGSWLGSIAS